MFFQFTQEYIKQLCIVFIKKYSVFQTFSRLAMFTHKVLINYCEGLRCSSIRQSSCKRRDNFLVEVCLWGSPRLSHQMSWSKVYGTVSTQITKQSPIGLQTHSVARTLCFLTQTWLTNQRFKDFDSSGFTSLGRL